MIKDLLRIVYNFDTSWIFISIGVEYLFEFYFLHSVSKIDKFFKILKNLMSYDSIKEAVNFPHFQFFLIDILNYEKNGHKENVLL